MKVALALEGLSADTGPLQGTYLKYALWFDPFPSVQMLIILQNQFSYPW